MMLAVMPTGGSFSFAVPKGISMVRGRWRNPSDCGALAEKESPSTREELVIFRSRLILC